MVIAQGRNDGCGNYKISDQDNPQKKYSSAAVLFFSHGFTCA
jgi:hypothetical protein